MAGPGDRSFPRTVGSVEVTRLDNGSVALRDLKNRAQPAAVVFAPQEWAAFLQSTKAGEFDFGPAGRPAPAAPAGHDVETTVRFTR